MTSASNRGTSNLCAFLKQVPEWHVLLVENVTCYMFAKFDIIHVMNVCAHYLVILLKVHSGNGNTQPNLHFFSLYKGRKVLF